MKKTRIYAVNNEGHDGFLIYLESHGRSELLMAHRHNGVLYGILKDGMPVEDLYRYRASSFYRGVGRGKYYRSWCDVAESQINHLKKVIESETELSFEKSKGKRKCVSWKTDGRGYPKNQYRHQNRSLYL